LAIDIAAVRRALPGLESMTYLNVGGCGITAEPVVQALLAATARLERQSFAVWDAMQQEMEAARARIATLLGAAPEEVAFTRNATDGVNLVVAGLPWHGWEEVIITNQEHPAMLFPWFYAQQRGRLRVKLLSVEPDPQATLRNLEALLTPQTRLIGVSHVSCQTGIRLPVQAICRLAAERGLLSLVDGAQAVGQFPVNVSEIGCDFYTGNGHKWLQGPKGTGFLYVRRERLAELTPMHVGAGCGESFSLEDGLRLKSTGQRFEYGTQALAPYLAWPAALDWLAGLGWSDVQARQRDLAVYLRQRLIAQPGITLHTPLDWESSSALTTFSVAGRKGIDLANDLRQQGIHTRPVAEFDALRISTAYFNTEAEIDRLLAMLGS